MDYMSSIGTDVAYRLGYDDVNESLCSAAIVHSTLAKLGVTRAVARAGTANGGWAAVMALGEVKVRVGSDPSASSADSLASRWAVLGMGGAGSELGTGLTLALPGQTSDAFDIETAATFWRQQVRKILQEFVVEAQGLGFVLRTVVDFISGDYAELC